MDKERSAKKPRRTFTGCWNCRSRGVKCDEKSPSCTPCLKKQQFCAGYQQKLVWVTSDQRSYRPGGRRTLDPVATWKGVPILDAGSIDTFIEKCDIAQEDHENNFVSYPPFAVFRSSYSLIRDVECADLLADFDDLSNSRTSMPSIHFSASITLLTPSSRHRLAPEEDKLFHHYASCVAPMLMPLDDTGNPWACYPAMALHYSSLGRKHLLHALLAHAAIFRGNIGIDRANMLAIGGHYYILAMEELRQGIEEDSIDYVGLLTTMMTFLFIELFRGSSKTWRCHYNAAWKFLQQQRDSKMWTSSEDAWYATQSFYLLRIMSETCLGGSSSHPHHVILESASDIPLIKFSSNARFGCTIGSSNILMSCISDINKLSQRRWVVGGYEVFNEIVTSILQRLQESMKAVTWSLDPTHDENNDTNGHLQRSPAKQAHLRAYTAAAFIYFYREIYDLPPRDIAPYVSEVLDSISTFTQLNVGNYTLWPVFIAAVEAYRESDINRFQELLNHACSVGMANRLKIKELIERIWKMREIQALQTVQEKDMIRINWRNVMEVLDTDVLLV